MPFDPNVPALNNAYQADIDKMRENFNQLRQHEKVSLTSDIDGLNGLTDGLIVYVTSEKAFYGVFDPVQLNKIKIADENGFNNFVRDPFLQHSEYGIDIFNFQYTFQDRISLNGNQSKLSGLYYVNIPAGKQLILYYLRFYTPADCIHLDVHGIDIVHQFDCATGNETSLSSSALWSTSSNFFDGIVNVVVADNSAGSTDIQDGIAVYLKNTDTNQRYIYEGTYFWLLLGLK